MASAKSEIQVRDVLKPLMLKDLRTNCRARNLNPGGSKDALVQRLQDDMMSTRNYTVVSDVGAQSVENRAPEVLAAAPVGNNYARAEGQNVGNFISDRPSSRVLAPPGGGSQICFGSEPEAPKAAQSQACGRATGQLGSGSPTNNNYHRPGGQNVGNFLTDRNSSRVSAPPGGQSQITFG